MHSSKPSKMARETRRVSGVEWNVKDSIQMSRDIRENGEEKAWWPQKLWYTIQFPRHKRNQPPQIHVQHTQTVTDYNNITEPRRYQRHKAISFALETNFTYVQRQITNERIFAKFH